MRWSSDASLWVDTYEVSTGDFKVFVKNTNYKTTADSLGWSAYFSQSTHAWEVDSSLNWSNVSPDMAVEDKLPVTQVSYDDACAYCAWKRGRLPSAEEWDIIAGDEVVIGNIWEGLFPQNDNGTDGYAMRPAPVGSFQPNEIGVHDLFGNVWEWTSSPAVHPNTKEAGNIIKGGSFLCQPDVCQGYIPKYYQVTPRNSGTNHLGFRCVYEP